MRLVIAVTISVLVPLAVAPQLGSAQTRWAVFSAASSERDVSRARDVADLAFTALEAHGEPVVARERTVARLESGLSHAFRPVDDEFVAHLARTAETVLEHVAFGRSETAREIGEPVLDAAEQNIVALGRLERARADVENLCLYLARAEVQQRRQDRARALAERCLRLSPTIDPDGRLHPPDVRTMVGELRDELDAGTAGGIVSVQSASEGPDSCTVRINGSTVGRTPSVRIPLPAGNYGVQLECDAAIPSRIFDVVVERGQPSRLNASAHLAQSLDTTGGHTTIAYASPTALAGHIAADVAELGRIIEVDRVLVGVVDGGDVSVRAFEIVRGATAARLTGASRVDDPLDISAITAAVERARSGLIAESAGVTTDVVGTAGRDADVRDGRGGTGIATNVIGGSLLTVGVVGLGVSWYLWTEIDARGQQLNRATSSTELTDRQRAYRDSFIPFGVTGGVGALLATAGLPLVLPDEDGVPWWSILFGVAGLGVGAAGVYFLATEGACYGTELLEAPCVQRSPNELLGAVVLGHAAPLLTIPLTYLIRDAASSSDEAAPAATLRVQPDRAELAFSGSF